MEVLKDSVHAILKHVERVVDELDENQVENLIVNMQKARKIFVYGAGRSGFAAKAFAMRLMHLGFDVNVIGEVITPAIEDKDLLINISGSGETLSVVNAARIAKNVGAKTIAITSYPNSTLGKISDGIVHVKGRTKLKGEKDFVLRQIKGEHYSLAPLGTLFEVTSSVFLDGLIVELMARLGKSEEDLRARHATIE